MLGDDLLCHFRINHSRAYAAEIKTKAVDSSPTCFKSILKPGYSADFYFCHKPHGVRLANLFNDAAQTGCAFPRGLSGRYVLECLSASCWRPLLVIFTVQYLIPHLRLELKSAPGISNPMYEVSLKRVTARAYKGGLWLSYELLRALYGYNFIHREKEQRYFFLTLLNHFKEGE